MTDSALQEIELTFGGKVYRLRPTFKVLIGIEAATVQPSRDLGLKIWNGHAALIELATVMQILLRDKGEDRSVEEIGEVLMDDGFLGLTDPLGRFLTRAQRGHKEHEREAVEAAKKAEDDKKKGASPDTAPADPPPAS